MAFAQGARTRLSYLEEVTFGTTPAATNFQEIPFSTHSIGLTKDRVEGTDIVSDRQARVDRHGNKTASGDIVADFRSGTFDTFLESLMFNTWETDPTTDELRVGTTLKHFSIEDYLADVDLARVYTGMTVSSMSISCRPNQMIQSTFSFVGKDTSSGATEKTTDAYVNSQPFDSYQGSFAIGDFGGLGTNNTTITAIDFTVNNNMNPTFVIGQDDTPQLEYGRCTVEGTLTAHIEDSSLLDRFINETETRLNLVLIDPADGTSQYSFFFPRVKINSGNTNVENPQSRFLTMDFVALYPNNALESSIVIRRPGTGS